MVFAHTIVEAPKYGASSRAAAISAPSVVTPTAKTSSSSPRAEVAPAREVGSGGCGLDAHADQPSVRLI